MAEARCQCKRGVMAGTKLRTDAAELSWPSETHTVMLAFFRGGSDSEQRCHRLLEGPT